MNDIKEDFLSYKWNIKKGFSIFLTLLVIFIAILLLPINIPYSIVVQGKIKPIREFILTKKTDGSIQTCERNNLLSLINSTQIYQIERGEYAGFRLNSPLLDKEIISKSDTVGRIFSSESQLNLTELQNRLAEAQMNLNTFKTGDKKNIIEIAQKREKLYQEQLENQKRILKRKEDLFNNNLLSQEELETERNKLKGIQLDLFNAKAEFERLSTGAKPEQIKYLESIVYSLKNKIKEVKDLSKNLNITAPFSGRIIHTFNDDTLLIIADRNSAIYIPVPVKYLAELRIGQEITIKADYLPNQSNEISGRILKINNSVEHLNQQEVVIVTGKINSKILDLPPNLVVSCTISLYQVPIRKHIFKFLISVFQALF